jgi:hypothetical protein
MQCVRTWSWTGVAVGLVASIGLATGLPAATAQSPAEVGAGSIDVGAGLTGAVDVLVKDVAELYGVDIELSFDPAVIQAVDADPAADGVQIQIGDFLDPGLAVRSSADNATGRVWFVMTQLSPSEPKSGAGRLFSVVFRGIRAGARSEITVVSASLAARSGARIAVRMTSGEVRVVSPGQAPPTPTPAPVTRSTVVLPATASVDRPGLAVPVTPAPPGGSAAVGSLAAGASPTGAPPVVGGAPLATAPAGATAAVPGAEGTGGAAAAGVSAPAPATASGEYPVATWTVPAPETVAAGGDAPVRSNQDGTGGDWLWLVGPIGLVVLVYAVVRGRRSGG